MHNGTRLAAAALALTLAGAALAQTEEPKVANPDAFDPVDVVRLRKEAAAAAREAGAAAKEAAAFARENVEQIRVEIDDQLAQAKDQLKRAKLAELGATQFRDFNVAVKMEKAAYLGAGVSSVDAAVRDQFKLDKGVGLVVDQVAPGSPAEAAGIKQRDILEKLNDQLLVNTKQFAVLVRTFKAGDEIKLTILREGERQTIPVKLEEKEVPVADGGDQFLMKLNADAANAVGRANAARIVANWRDPKGNFTTMAGPDGTRKQVFNDNNISATLSETKGERTLQVTDTKTGKVLFDGPVNTEEQRKELPQEAADVLKRMDEMKDRFGNGPKGMVLWGPNGAMAGGGGGFALTAPGRRTPRLPNGTLDAITWTDEDHTFALTAKKEGDARQLYLVAKNLEGTVVFDGAINTEDERHALPKDVAEKLDAPTITAIIDVMRGNVPATGDRFAPKPGPAPGRKGF